VELHNPSTYACSTNIGLIQKKTTRNGEKAKTLAYWGSEKKRLNEEYKTE